MIRFAIRAVLAVVVVLMVFGLTFNLAERHNLAAAEDLVKYCMEKGLNASWSTESKVLVTSFEVRCEKP